MHRVVLPDVNVTVPVAPPGRPESHNVSCVPYAVLSGDASSVKLVSADTIVKLAPDALVPL